MMVAEIRNEVEIASVHMGGFIVFDDIDVNVNPRVPQWP